MCTENQREHFKTKGDLQLNMAKRTVIYSALNLCFFYVFYSNDNVEIDSQKRMGQEITATHSEKIENK